MADWPEGMQQDWDRVEAAGVERGLDLYETVFAGVAFPLQRKRELAKAVARVRAGKPKTILEVGADKGGTLLHWVAGCPTVERVHAVEPRGFPYAGHLERMFPAVQFTWHSCGSETVGNLGPLDFAFLDGDKSYFYEDFLRFPSRVVAMHDVCDEPMRSAYLKLYAHGLKLEVITDTSDWDEEERRTHLPPETSWHGWLRCWKRSSCTFGFAE